MLAVELEPTQRCRTCGETKPLSEFDVRADTRTYKTQCKACRRAYQNARNERLSPPKPEQPKRVASANEPLQCTRCGELKPASGFPRRRRDGDHLQTWCRSCFSEVNRGNYRASHETYLRRLSTNTQRIRSTVRARIDAYLLAHPCVDCGETDIDVLEFDHLSDKRMEVSRLWGQGYPWRVIEAEIAKCEVRCGNCHRRKTYERRTSEEAGAWTAAA